MLGYMNQEALQKTIDTQWVTFYSRTKERLWTKGETSGNKLKVVGIFSDCDQDTLLITADPTGPVCHNGTTTCFPDLQATDWDFIQKLEHVIAERKLSLPENSYTTTLFNAGISRIAQKIGEEGVEVALAAIEKNNAEICGEIADLLFHVLVLLKAKNLSLSDVIDVLKQRNFTLRSDSR
jgi:phosphoribosyl-ATP pyrophosphohydrolase/phosphoribosyl-AMP cyclohydrolase